MFYFHPYLGKIPILTNIFQKGWHHHVFVMFNFKIIPKKIGRQGWVRKGGLVHPTKTGDQHGLFMFFRAAFFTCFTDFLLSYEPWKSLPPISKKTMVPFWMIINLTIKIYKKMGGSFPATYQKFWLDFQATSATTSIVEIMGISPMPRFAPKTIVPS